VSAAAGLKLSVFFGERDVADGRFLAERIIAEGERAGVAGAILMRGVEGFGIKHRRRTDRLLTLSEDLPVVAIAVGGAEPVEEAAARIGRIDFDGLVTLERLRLLTPPAEAESAMSPVTQIRSTSRALTRSTNPTSCSSERFCPTWMSLMCAIRGPPPMACPPNGRASSVTRNSR